MKQSRKINKVGEVNPSLDPTWVSLSYYLNSAGKRALGERTWDAGWNACTQMSLQIEFFCERNFKVR